MINYVKLNINRYYMYKLILLPFFNTISMNSQMQFDHRHHHIYYITYKIFNPIQNFPNAKASKIFTSFQTHNKKSSIISFDVPMAWPSEYIDIIALPTIAMPSPLFVRWEGQWRHKLRPFPSRYVIGRRSRSGGA